MGGFLMKLKKVMLMVGGTAIIALVLVVLSVFIHYYGDWLWFQNLGFSQVLTFAAFSLIFAIFGGVNIFMARKWGAPSRPKSEITPPSQVEQINYLNILFKERYAPYVWTLIIFFLSIIMGLSTSDSWMTFLKFINPSEFGVVDPIFSKDVGFYELQKGHP
jgi:uncharacterized membrane protein (UPF0182 family)